MTLTGISVVCIRRIRQSSHHLTIARSGRECGGQRRCVLFQQPRGRDYAHTERIHGADTLWRIPQIHTHQLRGTVQR